MRCRSAATRPGGSPTRALAARALIAASVTPTSTRKAANELSAVFGCTYDCENQFTDYQNGSHKRLEWGTSKFLARPCQVGLVGCGYQQISADGGLGDRLGRVVRDRGFGRSLAIFFRSTRKSRDSVFVAQVSPSKKQDRRSRHKRSIGSSMRLSARVSPHRDPGAQTRMET